MRIPKLSALNNKHVLALIGNVVISAFSVITMSVLLRTMTKADVGVWFFFLSINGLCDALRNGFLSTGTIKFYAGTPKERAEIVLGSVWFLALGVSLTLMALDACAMPFMSLIKNPEVLLVIKWFGVTVLSSVTFNITFWILVADEDYLTILWLRLVNNVSMIVIILILAYLKKATLENLLIVNFATNILTSVACIVFGYSHVETIFKRTRECMVQLAQFGKYSLATNLSSNLLGSVNTFIIIPVLGPTALAVYAVPNKLMEIVEILLRTFVGTGMSAMATAYNTDNMHHLTFVTKKYAGMLTLLFIPLVIGAFFFADFAIWLLSGDQYKGTEAANIFRIFMCMAILYPVDRFNGVTLDIIHKPQINFYKVIIMVVVNVLATSIGLYLFRNIYGAAFAAPFATIAGLLFGYYHLKRNLDGYSLRSVMTTGYAESKLFINQMLAKFGRAKA
ncbi:O-antigen/teichoic acid export membrane protein [Mucilaginibacter gracilis]|uniref:O-antigen/teichoic acid export membrane protein n=1 Tax=Mucilaginibacter gracilis TaxID=423350 RepID=A0A495JB32_9SPHI|nr:oligosaccharide flippase family protein [Mucilaginibacter gracilis]RKR85698.1 O-antigen/teichoic acid export membrane protein [Mucilaginibacter gracilis]